MYKKIIVFKIQVVLFITTFINEVNRDRNDSRSLLRGENKIFHYFHR